MKLTNKFEVESFRKALEEAQGAVYLKSNQGDVLNLKSTISQYIAIGRLLTDLSSELELFCSRQEDEAIFLQFFEKNPNTL